MERKENDGLTLKEALADIKIDLEVDDFIRKRRHHVPKALFLPIPEVPRNLMDEESADKAERLLEEAREIVGPFGAYISKKDTEEFQAISSAFEELTGVDVWEIISEARERMLSKVSWP